MNIAIVGYFNPKCISEYLFEKDIPLINEAATAVNILVKAFLDAGHYVKVFTSFPEQGVNRIIKGKNIEVHLVSSYSKIKKFSFFSRVYMVNRLINLMEGQIDDVNVIHAHWTYEFALAAKHFADKKQVVCTVRDWCPYILSIQTSLKDKIIWLISYIIFRKVMNGILIHFVANSQYTYDKIMSDYPQKEVQIIPNPIEQSLILSEKKNQSVSHKFISIAQRIDDKRKNIPVLLKAFDLYKKKYSDSSLTLVGDYDANGTLYKTIAQNSSSGVKITGKLSRCEIINLIDESSCLVHPSLEETFGNILLEAMARKIPCIGGEESGAVPTVLGNGKCGILCDITDYQAIYSAMLSINEVDLRNRIINNATKMIKDLYSSDVIVDQHIHLYNELLSINSK